jgi:hypothetical protein
MALQIRRGTNKERLQITPAQGELIYVTDYELATISVTAINITTNVLTSVAHKLTTNQQIRFQDTTKNGLTLNQVYYVASTPDPDTFTLKATLSGATLDITGTYTTPLVFATGPTNAAGTPTGINVTAVWIGDGNTVGGVPGNTQGLDDLTDVTITTPAEGNTLYYDATTKQWKNTNILNIDDVSGTQNIYINATGDSTIKRTTSTYPELGHSILNLYNNKSTATPVNGFGSTLGFYADNAVGTIKHLGYANFKYDDITTGSEDAGLSIVLMENGVSPAYPTPGSVSAQLRLDSAGNLAVRGDLTVNSDTGNNQSTINFNHPTANGSITWQGTAHFLSGDLVVNGGTDNIVVIDAASNTGIANIFNGAIGTINMGNGVVTELNLGNTAAGSRVRVKSPQTDIDGALTVTGNLTVNGTTTTVNSTTMTVDDPNLVLNAVGSPTDTNANLGGITVKGATDKILYWNNSDKRWYFDNGTGGQVDGANKMVVDLTDIRSVETTQFNKGHMFFYDGTNWINGSNIKFAATANRPKITTEVNLDSANAVNSGGVNTALNLIKDTTTAAYTDGVGTGIIMSVVSGQTGQTEQKDIIRLHGQYDSAGAHDASIVATTTDNNTYAELYRASKNRTNINNGVLYVNAENGRVGINTVSPNLSLEVQGNAYVSSTLEVIGGLTARDVVNVGGETITMNYGFTGAPSQNVAIVVERGNETDAYWKWTENGDYWNTNHSIIADGAITAVGALGTNGLNIIFNNDDATPAQFDHANLLVKRGAGTDIILRWNEDQDRWQFTNDGSTYTNMPVATDTPTYVGLNTTTGNISVNNKTFLYGDTGDVRVGNDLKVGGDFIIMNELLTTAPTLNASFIVERGDQANTVFRWNEGNDRWESTVDGSAYIALPNQSLDQGSSPTFSSLTANGNLVVNGSVDLGTGAEDLIRIGGLVGNNITFTSNDSATPRGILGNMSTGAPDYWFVGGAETGGTLNAGYLLLATGDDGNDPIYARQYTGSPLSSTTYRELTLLDGSGNTIIPGTLEIDGNIIKASDGVTALTLAASTGNVTVAGDLFVAGNGIFSNGGYENLNFPLNTTNVKVIGDLIVGGSDIKDGNGTTSLSLYDANVKVAGELTINGNKIRSSSGTAFPSGDIAVQLSGSNVEVVGNLTLGSNIIKSSNGTTAIETTSTGDIIVTDDIFAKGNYVQLNYAATGTPTTGTAGIEVERGDLTNVQLAWSESSDRWIFTNDGTNYTNIPVAADTPTYAGLNITNDITATNITATGNLTLTGNTIKKSGGTDVITFSGTNLTTFAGDIKLGGNTVYDSAGNNVLDFKTTSSIYGPSYQAKFNTSVNYGLSASYLFLDNMVEINTSSLTTTSTTTAVLDYFDPASYRSAKYLIQITNGSSHQMWEGMMIHDGTNIIISAYGDLRTGANLATVSAAFNVSTGYPELRVTPVNATQTKFKATKTYIAV